MFGWGLIVVELGFWQNSLLFNDGDPWAEKDTGRFDVAQGSYDGAEYLELVGLFMLSKLEKVNRRLSIGIYRDDCLAVTNASKKQTEDLKKKMCEFFFSRKFANNSWSKYQPSGTRSPPATPHRLQNPKWPPGGPKMAEGVWKGVYP